MTRMGLTSVLCHSPAVQPWATHFLSLDLSFLFGETKIKIVLFKVEFIKIE